MANVKAPQNTRQLKNILVIIDAASGGSTAFQGCTQSFQFQPQTTTSSTLGGTPDDVWTDTTVTGWQLNWKFLQDAETLGSLTDYLYQHGGEVHQVDFVPYGGTGWTAKVILPAPPIGGDLNAWLADTITCGVRGKPTRIVDDPNTPQQ